ncbi:MAG: hypothetical protein AMJ95_08545 [Omnitrophica WOR_2 bacterium SM23_72]|nr:MAG: hypothetical protein AMJ95_08545 [Omnitrophica WOR_2 bacterium SM23_72]
MHKIGLRSLIAICLVLGVAKVGLCETKADKMLQSDILNNLIRIDPNSGKPTDPEVVSQKVLKVINDESTGQWKEILEEWQLKWDAQEGTFIIQLVPAADGGVNFSIIPKPIAEKMGLLEGITEEIKTE